MEKISNHLYALGYEDGRVVLDLSIARGLAYYTGPVFEASLLDAPEFGSVFGGGRYDDLVMRFLGEKVPATGASMGVDRLLAALIHLKRAGRQKSTAKVLITNMDAGLADDYIAMTWELRRAGIPTELYLGQARGPGKQLKYADYWGVPIALLYGSNEKEKGIVTLKDMDAGRQRAEALANRQECLRISTSGIGRRGTGERPERGRSSNMASPRASASSRTFPSLPIAWRSCSGTSCSPIP